MNLKRFFTPIPVVVLCLLIAPFVSLGQDPNGPSGDPDEPQDVPIDGGASLLAGAAVAYGARKLSQRKNEKC